MIEIIMGVAIFAFKLYSYLILYYIISSWIPALGDNPFGKFVRGVVEPYLAIFRKFIPPLGMIDLSPIVAIYAYYFIGGLVLDGLHSLLALFM